MNTYKVHGGAFQPAAHLGWVELVLAPRYWKGCHCSGLQKTQIEKIEKNNIKKSPQFLGALSQWAQQKMDLKRKRWLSPAVKVLLRKAQPLEFPSLEAVKLSWQDFLSIPVLLIGSACKFITAQQFGWWWLKGGEGGVKEEEGIEVEKQMGQPCQPWDLPWPATATPPRG